MTLRRPRCAMPISIDADARFGRVADDLVEDRHQHVEPFDREARLAVEGAVQEALEGFDLGETIEQRDRVDRIGRRAEAAVLRGLRSHCRSSGTKTCA